MSICVPIMSGSAASMTVPAVAMTEPTITNAIQIATPSPKRNAARPRSRSSAIGENAPPEAAEEQVHELGDDLAQPDARHLLAVDGGNGNVDGGDLLDVEVDEQVVLERVALGHVVERDVPQDVGAHGGVAVLRVEEVPVA